MKPFFKYPLVGQFRAAALLANEWRDTLYATTVATASSFVAHQVGPAHGMGLATLAVVTRESIRAASWYGSEPIRCWVGGENKIIDKNLMTTAAVTGTLFSFAVGTALLTLKGAIPVAVGFPIAQMSLIASAYGCAVAGGVKRVIDAYATMWDWGRDENNPNGGGYTRRALNLVRDFASSLNPLRPKTPVPVRVPVNHNMKV